MPKSNQYDLGKAQQRLSISDYDIAEEKQPSSYYLNKKRKDFCTVLVQSGRKQAKVELLQLRIEFEKQERTEISPIKAECKKQ